jgi:hypothetical protein
MVEISNKLQLAVDNLAAAADRLLYNAWGVDESTLNNSEYVVNVGYIVEMRKALEAYDAALEERNIQGKEQEQQELFA